MNNEIWEKFEEYNNGGIYNAPISQYMPIFTSTNTSTGFGPIVWPKPNTVELEVKETINTDVIRKGPSETEEYVRRELARKLAEKLIEEDLIRIYADKKNELGETEFRAIVKVIQE